MIKIPVSKEFLEKDRGGGKYYGLTTVLYRHKKWDNLVTMTGLII